MTHNKDIVIFNDIACHSKIMKECLKATRVFSKAYMMAFVHDNISSSKQKLGNFKGNEKGKANSSYESSQKKKNGSTKEENMLERRTITSLNATIVAKGSFGS